MKKPGSSQPKTQGRSKAARGPKKRRSSADLEKQLDRRIRELSKTRKQLKQALQQQDATSEVLQAVNSSQGELAPVFDAMLQRAMRLCEAAFGGLWIFEGERYVAKALCGVPSAYADYLRKTSVVPGPHTAPYRFLHGELSAIQNVDLAAEKPYLAGDPQRRALVDLGGARAALQVPLVRNGIALGVITVYRQEVRAFSEQHVMLLQHFAAQAVIAIENGRLFNETREALEQQTATADILRVIASSPDRAQPVFDAIAESARRLLGSFTAVVTRVIGGEVHLAASTAENEAAAHAAQGLLPYPLTSDRIHARVARTGQVVSTPDIRAATHVPEDVQTFARTVGWRSILVVPMLLNGVSIGTVGVTRKNPGPFDDKTVGLLRMFADQAVIAIENARLFNETQEALEQQTATSEVLEVISSSPSELDPVFQKMLENATRVCGASFGTMNLWNGDEFINVARHNTPQAFAAVRQHKPIRPHPATPMGRVVRTHKAVHEHDLKANAAYIAGVPNVVAIVDVAGARTILVTPMLKGEKLIGTITIFRQEVRPFTDKQVALVENFTKQAVIAIENARLFNETREALEQQTATADILRVIASSPSDARPVFEAIATSAKRLLGGFSTAVFQFIDDAVHLAAFTPVHPVADQALRTDFPQPTANFVAFQLAQHGEPVILQDTEEVSHEPVRDIARLHGFRSMLWVPMVNSGVTIGIISVTRAEAGGFAPNHIQLLQTFADQAVIAIENVRLFDEVRQRTDDLSEALRQQTATGEVLKVIASSPTDVSPALQAIVESACAFCDAYDAGVLLKIGEDLHFSAHHGPIQTGGTPRPISRDWVVGRSVIDKVPVQVSDFQAPGAAEFPEGQRQSREQGHRCTLSVPLLREGDAIGAIALRRREPVAFTEKQVALLQSFADQAVIAIGNVRLFEEVQGKTRDLSEALTYQTGSANILNVIASSPTDVGPVLQAIVQSACELCGAYDSIALLKEDDHLRLCAHHGPIPLTVENWPISRGWVSGLAFVDQKPVHVMDIMAEGEASPEGRELSVRRGHRTMVAVPLLSEGESIGALILCRNEVNPFTDKQIALLQTFADQAVIAIGNVRLFEEVQARTRELSESLDQQVATSEVLHVISSSPGELEPVFRSMLANATRLCEAECGVMWLHEADAFRSAAIHGPLPPAYVEQWRSGTPVILTPHAPLTILTQTHQPVHIPDMRQDRSYLNRDPLPVAAVEVAGIRTLLLVPMLKEGNLVGGIAIYRQEVRPFTDKQVEVVSTFARQAVIAIENARLLKELRQRTHDLSQSLHELRTTQDRLVQTEKLASLGQLTAGIAHEIKNPLNFVNNFSALSAELTGELGALLKRVTMTGKEWEEVFEITTLLKENLEKIAQHGKRADSIVKNMLLHSREGGGEQRSADINALVEESLNLAYHGARAEMPDFNITLQRDFDAGAEPIELFPQEITRALLNLLSNGFYAATKRRSETAGAEFEPILVAATRDLGSTIEIRIRDNGAGIPSELKEKIFNPFFTTKPPGEGTGLGLSMSHDIIVKQHGGRIDIDTEPGAYTEFIISLPRKKTK